MTGAKQDFWVHHMMAEELGQAPVWLGHRGDGTRTNTASDGILGAISAANAFENMYYMYGSLHPTNNINNPKPFRMLCRRMRVATALHGLLRNPIATGPNGCDEVGSGRRSQPSGAWGGDAGQDGQGLSMCGFSTWRKTQSNGSLA